MAQQTQIPRVLWAQQRDTVLLTIAVPDINSVFVKFEDSSVNFHGEATTGKDKTVYDVKIDLYEKIDPDTCKYTNIGQKYWRLLLKKKDAAADFWPRLTKDKTRFHWLQVDFDHWKDDDESADEEKPGLGGNFQDMFGGGMGGMGGMGGLGGMGGMGGMPGMDDFPGAGGDSDEEEADSDDEGSKPSATGTSGNTAQGENNTATTNAQESSTNGQAS